MSNEKGDPTNARDRTYAVSANRHRAQHKLRYVEMSAAAENGECRLCKGAIVPQEPGEGDTDLAAREQANTLTNHD
ncbi:hypothetical protein CWE22_01475 [Pseudidiomarina aestuarii]|uniref:Uncharacterized protein n=1 Tax=Pseudidiomarina aestuarii TaxID=624146 RepID=A0A7Z6ZT50_9GAMM|nr:hypothetical protein [Pseudidiomarina aestuarii]RUO40894.1 hypothetical protein CWE22_01475 [Pseudidiomarina aestuarii]